MKKQTLITAFLGMLLLMQFSGLSQENTTEGTVYYIQMDKVEFEPTGRPEFDQWASTMPTDYEFEKVLYFDKNHALFTDSPNPAGEPMSRRERWFYHMSKFGRKPKATLTTLYCNFEKKEKTEVLDFMTREFRVNTDLEPIGWKINNEFKSILGYNCMSAEMTDGEDQVIAYFTPEIPISAGPDAYYGLPGLIMAIEKNGYTTYLAARVIFNPVEEQLVEPDSGKKVTHEELDQIIQEKIEEFKNERKGRDQHGRH